MDAPVEETQALLKIEQANFRHLVWDIAWFGLAFPAVGSFLSIFAIQLGATPFELGLLSSLPSIFLLLASALSDGWRARYADSIKALLWPATGMRVRLLIFACLPFLPGGWQIPVLLAVAALAAVPQGISSIIFLVMMREAVTDQRFTALMSRRFLALNLGLGAGTLGLGLWLERAPFPANYQVMFVVAFGLTMVSLWHVQQIRVISATPLPASTSPASRPWRSPEFRRLASIVGAVFMAFFAIVPVIPLRLVHGLGASEGFVAIYGFLELTGGATMATVAHRLIDRVGLRHTLLLGMTGTGLAAVILALAPSLYLALPAALLSGACWTLTDISQFTFFSLNTPAESRARRTRAYFQAVSIAIFVGPLLGSTLADSGLSLGTVLLLGAGLRFLAGLLVRWGAAATPSPAAPAVSPA